MDKLLEIERILQDAAIAGEGAMSLAELKRRMTVSVRHKTVKDCIDVLHYFGRAATLEDGVIYAAGELPELDWVRLA